MAGLAFLTAEAGHEESGGFDVALPALLELLVHEHFLVGHADHYAEPEEAAESQRERVHAADGTADGHQSDPGVDGVTDVAEGAARDQLVTGVRTDAGDPEATHDGLRPESQCDAQQHDADTGDHEGQRNVLGLQVAGRQEDDGCEAAQDQLHG